MADNETIFVDPVEDCPWRSPRETLASLGYQPIAPVELSDRQLPGRLWELLYAAAARRFFFYGTDHLSDRELYTMLWERWLDSPTPDIPLEAETNTNLSLSEFDHKGLTSDEIWVRYYADEEMRSVMERDEVLPPHEDPPFDRDRFLPVAPIPIELRDPAMLPGRNPRGGWFHDILGSWGDSEIQLWLRHYASDEERAKYIAEETSRVLPPKEKPIARRDWRLPKGPF